MNTKDFIQLLSNEKAVANIDLKQLDTVLENFPYFQSARMLYLKNLKLNNNFRFNSYLKTTAAYVSDRTVLFEYITKEPEENILQEAESSQKTEKKDKLQEAIKASENISINKKEEKKIETEPKPVHDTLNFSEDDKFSFNEWLQLSNVRQIHRTIDEKIAEKHELSKQNKKIDSDKKSNFDLIDKFIDSNPKLRPVPKDEAVSGNIALSSTKENDGWMTETLAQVYVEQKKYSKAIKAYKILGLKYPEKSGFFADRIRSIKKLSEY
ncbi:MAG: hypothetical protein ABFR62_01265 [Bacteroidota bacterium]